MPSNLDEFVLSFVVVLRLSWRGGKVGSDLRTGSARRTLAWHRSGLDQHQSDRVTIRAITLDALIYREPLLLGNSRARVDRIQPSIELVIDWDV